MKKQLLLGLLVLVGLQLSVSAASPGAQDYNQRDRYSQENNATYDDDYADVDWDAIDPASINYCYYDDDDVCLVNWGARVFLMPYDFFYDRIYLHHRYGMRYYPYSYFANWWGISFYNHIWDRYNWNHHRDHYRNGHNYYGDHQQRPPIVIRKGDFLSRHGIPGTVHNYRDSQSTMSRHYSSGAHFNSTTVRPFSSHNGAALPRYQSRSYSTPSYRQHNFNAPSLRSYSGSPRYYSSPRSYSAAPRQSFSSSHSSSAGSVAHKKH